MTATLKRLLGNAGAGIDESHGTDRLYDVLVAMAEVAGEKVHAYQATIATGTIGGMVCDKAGTLTMLRTSVGTTGTAGDTDIQVHLNGASQGEITVDNTDADGTKSSLALAVAVVAGDLIELVVSAAPTAGSDLVASATVLPITIEP